MFSPRKIEWESLCELAAEKGIVGKGKGCYTLIQGVTAPLNCRVFINPRSYVLISSSIPLCHLQLSDKHFRKIYYHLKVNLQYWTVVWSEFTVQLYLECPDTLHVSSQSTSSSITCVNYTWWLPDTRIGTAKSWGHGPYKVFFANDDDSEFRSRCEWIIPFFTLNIAFFQQICLGFRKLKKKTQKEKIEGGGVPTPPGWWGWKPGQRHQPPEQVVGGLGRG